MRGNAIEKYSFTCTPYHYMTIVWYLISSAGISHCGYNTNLGISLSQCRLVTQPGIQNP